MKDVAASKGFVVNVKDKILGLLRKAPETVIEEPKN